MKVSVITTLYNYAEFIEDTIISFLKQNIESEMIIVDDGSGDNPYKVIKPYISANVKYIKLERNFGYSYAKNVGIKTSRSETIAMLDADDMLTDNSLINRISMLNDNIHFVHGPVLHLKAGRLSQSTLWKQWCKSDKGPTSYKYVHAQGVMLRKDIHRKIGLYDVSLRCKSDREMWARIFNHNFKIATVSTPVAVYRTHSAQMSRSKSKLSINDKLQSHVLSLIDKRKHDLTGLDMLD